MITPPSRLPSKLGASRVKRRRGLGGRAEVPHTPRHFAKRGGKLMKTKEAIPKKESEEKLRGGKSLRARKLRKTHRNSAGERMVAAKTHGVAEERRDETGTLSA